MSERATVRPVTLARLVELTHVCESASRTTGDVESLLDVTHRRARETILEAERLGFVAEDDAGDDAEYATTTVGQRFLDAVREEAWTDVSGVLETRSPHYGAFLDVLEEVAPARLETVLETLEQHEMHTGRSYNQTSVEVLGDWAERLGRIQRNAFTGAYYLVEHETVPPNFPYELLSAYDDLEETAGVDLRQRYLSIPELRETLCERLGCTREAVDEGLRTVAQQNVGRVELSGAPIDTGAKDAQLGIKNLDLADSDGLVSTSQSTDQVMAGIEQYDKQYYYLAVHDRELTYSPDDE
jgi:hypothetical protein